MVLRNLITIIKIQESYKYNYEELENNYEKITINLFQQTILIHNNDDNNLFNLILNINEIFEEAFKDNNELFVTKKIYKNSKKYLQIKLIISKYINLIISNNIYYFTSLQEIRFSIFLIFF